MIQLKTPPSKKRKQESEKIMNNTKNISETGRKRWKTIGEFFQESEDFFKEQELVREDTENVYHHIISTIDNALTSKDYAALSALIPYIEKGDGFLAFQYIGKTHRLLRLLTIIALEEKYQKRLFCEDCFNTDELYEKYILTVFAFRRLLFHLSPESVEEAVTYLQNHPISHFAAYWILQGDLLIPSRKLCENLAAIYTDEWSPEDIQQFFYLLSTLSDAGLMEEPYEQP